MSPPILATKLFTPSRRPKVVLRPRLNARLNEGLRRKLTLISAPAGFGKTTLIADWGVQIADWDSPQSDVRNTKLCWLSLDEADNDPTRFLTYLIAALQTIVPTLGDGVIGALQSPQPPPIESILTAVLNAIALRADNFVLVLDDYHLIDAKAVDTALTFLLEHLPPQLHIVLATREDPQLPLARLRAQEELTELRASDLRFTPAEAAKFLNQVMGLNLPALEIEALETRTEGWIAGLQLAALALQGQVAMQGHKDTTAFVKSFTGSHRFVVDYLVEQVLEQQPESVQNFLLCTSILDRMCGPLCEAVLRDPSVPGQETLEALERANLFIVPLDNERRWYRYHHLFAELLRQRLQQHPLPNPASAPTEGGVHDLHVRASQWYEDNGLDLEAFQHAAAANDVERAERLMGAKGIPRHFFGGVTPILDWLESLPKSVLDARPWLWVSFGALLLIAGRTFGVAEKLNAGEAALQAAGLVTSDGLPVAFGEQRDENNKSSPSERPDARVRYLVGHIAAARATLALTRYDVAAMFEQSGRALEFLRPDDLSYRTSLWVQGFAYYVRGERRAARRSFKEAIALSQASGDMFTTILATIGLGNVQEADNELHQAAETYRRVLDWAGEHPQQIVHEAQLGLARVLYEWNDLTGAEQHAQVGLRLARQYEDVIDRYIFCQVFLARVMLARGDASGAVAMLAESEQSAREHNFVYRIPEIAAAQVLTLLRQDKLKAAAELAHKHALPLSAARVQLAQGEAIAALEVLDRMRRQAEGLDLVNERLKVSVLLAIAHDERGDGERAMQALGEALELAEPGGFIRIFVDEGFPIARLLSAALERGIRPDYIGTLLAGFEDAMTGERRETEPVPGVVPHSSLVEPLSPRELQVLELIAQGLSNREISERLSVALITVKGHNQKIFGKLQVQRRTEAVARARALGLL